MNNNYEPNLTPEQLAKVLAKQQEKEQKARDAAAKL